MIVLDTNVISALMRRTENLRIVSWFDRQPPESIWTTAITVFEIRLGIEVLATGRRRRQLEEMFGRMLEDDMQGRVLHLDATAAREAAQLAARRQALGRPMELRDTFIAGIVIARNAILATRNVRHFQDLNSVTDPWAD